MKQRKIGIPNGSCIAPQSGAFRSSPPPARISIPSPADIPTAACWPDAGKGTQRLKEIDSEACFLALIEGIEDPFNFGMILRTLYAAGCDGVILPPRNWTSAAATVARASAGASEYLPLIIADEMQQTLHALKQNGITLICAERKDAVCLYDFSFLPASAWPSAERCAA